MKNIRTYSLEMTAIIAVDLLKSNDIAAVVRGVRDYSSIIMGGSLGTYDVLVDESDYEQADELLKEFDKQNV